MSKRLSNTPKKPDSTPPAPKPAARPGGAPARKRVSSVPVAARPQQARRDWWPWNLMGALVAAILGMGVLVWGLRSLATAAPATPTPAPPSPTLIAGLPTQAPAEGSPVTGVLATPTLSAPEALTSGPYADVSQFGSSVGAVDPQQVHPVLPPEIPAAHIAFSAETHDWGQIAPSGIVSQVITVANPGNRPLQIDKLLSSCSCLSGTLSAQKLPVGRRATLVVLYNPGLDGTRGVVQRTLTVLSTAGDTPVKELTFQATIP